MASRTTPSHRSRARDVIQKLLDQAFISREEITRELLITERLLDAFADGSKPIPLDRQLLLAALVIERVPRLQRAGYQLREQVVAAVRFSRGGTTASFNAPVSRA